MEFDSRENKYLRAKAQVAEMKKFYTSLMLYVVFMCFLGALNYYTNQWRYMWFLWAAFGWGIGLIFQALKAFNWAPFMNKSWEERKIKEYMEREEQQDEQQRWN
ncbi:MAG: 2TM domain-containing protein [Alteromonas sp.]|nr:2TM domain-containing protein [Flavobacteriaceae bacterium]MCB9213285.1 2TM domain-containing protein [Alteromonas sp.]